VRIVIDEIEEWDKIWIANRNHSLTETPVFTVTITHYLYSSMFPHAHIRFCMYICVCNICVYVQWFVALVRWRVPSVAPPLESSPSTCPTYTGTQTGYS
jgi:hypothetical protein